MFLLLMNLLMLQRLYIDHIRPIPLQILVLIVLLVIWNEKLDLSQDAACNEARTHGDRKIAITSIAVDSGFTNAVHASLQLSCMLVHEWAMIECFIDSTLPQGLQVRGALRRGWGVDANHARGARHIGQAWFALSPWSWYLDSGWLCVGASRCMHLCFQFTLKLCILLLLAPAYVEGIHL